MVEFNALHAEALYVRFCAIYGDKFVKPYHTGDFKKIWFEEWASGLTGIDVTLIKNVLETCKRTVEWPPSIAEFRAICEKASGIPSLEQSMNAALRGDFSHPITAMAYDKVGSWAMKNSKEAELAQKFKVAYQEALNAFRQDPESAKKYLLGFEERKALPEPPPKFLTQEEIIEWRGRLQKYQSMANAEKAKLEAKDHPAWPREKITRGHVKFDKILFNDRKRYLISLDEIISGTLPVEDAYDRIRYLREIDGIEQLKEGGLGVGSSSYKKQHQASYSGSTNRFDKWND